MGGLIGGFVLMWLMIETRRSALASIAATAGVIAVSLVVTYMQVRNYQ